MKELSGWSQQGGLTGRWEGERGGEGPYSQVGGCPPYFS